MNERRSQFGQRRAGQAALHARIRRAFTLLEILMVVAIIGILATLLGSVVTGSIRKVREAATTALLNKLEGLMDQRLKGFERATKSRDFQRIVEIRKRNLERLSEDRNGNGILDPGEDSNGNSVLDGGVFGVSAKVLSAVARKDFLRQNFPQRWEDVPPTGGGTGDGEDLNYNGTLDTGEDKNGNGTLDGTDGIPDLVTQNCGTLTAAQLSKLQSQGLAEPGNPTPPASLIRDVTESSELLYFALTTMQVFGVAPVAESEFGTSEVRDTDGDGLLEFIDGWGRPLRFYRWPTRLLKPNGVFGPDGRPGAAGVNDVFPVAANGLTDDASEIGATGTDDYSALNPINIAIPAVSTDPNTPLHMIRRDIAMLLIDGLPGAPATYTVGANTLRVRYDTLDEDPDDPYGLIVAEMQRLAGSGINILALGGYTEGDYPTLDTYHTPLIVSAGADGVLGLLEPHILADTNGDGIYDQFGVLAQPVFTGTNPNDIPSTTISALTDNLTNRNRRAGRGK